jgi:polyisoprenoid-binding protein YceI
MADTSPGADATPLPPDAVGDWTLDPAGTDVTLNSKAMWGLAKVKGTLRATEGSGSIDPNGQISGQLVIDANSINTKNQRRDKHLRSADFFEVDKYPAITYQVTGGKMVDNQHVQVTGTLEVRGTTEPLDVVATVDEVSPTRAVVTATATGVDRRKWGLTWAKMGAGVINTVTVRAAFSKASLPTEQSSSPGE